MVASGPVLGAEDRSAHSTRAAPHPLHDARTALHSAAHAPPLPGLLARLQSPLRAAGVVCVTHRPTSGAPAIRGARAADCFPCTLPLCALADTMARDDEADSVGPDALALEARQVRAPAATPSTAHPLPPLRPPHRALVRDARGRAPPTYARFAYVWTRCVGGSLCRARAKESAPLTTWSRWTMGRGAASTATPCCGHRASWASRCFSTATATAGTRRAAARRRGASASARGAARR